MLLHKLFRVYWSLSRCSVTSGWFRSYTPFPTPRDRTYSCLLVTLCPWIRLLNSSYVWLLVVNPRQDKWWYHTNIRSNRWEWLLRDKVVKLTTHCCWLLYIKFRLLLMLAHLELTHSSSCMVGLWYVLVCWLQLIVINKVRCFFNRWFAH